MTTAAAAALAIRGVSGTYPNRVFGDVAPGPGFEPAEPDLQDVYFGAMAGRVGRRRARPEVAA